MNWHAFLEYWPHLTFAATLQLAIWVIFLPWVLLSRKEPTTTVAWCLVVLLMPYVGALLFWAFGYNYLLLRVQERRRQRPDADGVVPLSGEKEGGTLGNLCRLAWRVGAFQSHSGNAVALFHETTDAFAALLSAVEAARDHIHLEFFIFRSDAAGGKLIDLLARKAKAGVEVRLLYDAMGCVHLRQRTLDALSAAGGCHAVFLPLNPLRSRVQINLRNHRKIAVIDGRVAFTGGMNIGDEYLHQSKRFGYWRDSFLRLEGPAVGDLQTIFAEDWNFAGQDLLQGERYFPKTLAEHGTDGPRDATVQVARSGPDQETNTIREIIFMAILGARERLWLASPYFIPDAGLFDALRVARYRDVDVRLLTLLKPDHFLSYHASRYYYRELLQMGVRIYQYTKGMMHSKLMLVDGQVALVGSANFDNRSLRLNFEAGVLLPTPRLVEELETAYLRDLETAVELTLAQFGQRPVLAQVIENACRLFAPTL